MKITHRIGIVLVLAILAPLLTGCAGLGQLFATATLTPSPTPSATVTALPSATPSPTATFTLTPTRTPTSTPPPTRTLTATLTPSATTTVYVLPTIACAEKGTIQISNTTNAVVELHLTGTGPYLFYLNAGDSSIEVCPGQYIYVAYGCGGATASGTMSSGEEHEFFCK